MSQARDDMREYEATLRRRYEDLWADVRRELQKHHGEQYEDIIDARGDAGDLATADLLLDLNLTEIDRDVDELRAVEHALAKIKRGTYGVCESCGKAIDPARLRAVPYATLCIDCQARAERNTSTTPSL